MGAMRLRSPIVSNSDDVAVELVKAKEYARAERLAIASRVLTTVTLITFAICGGSSVAQLLKMF